MGFTYTDKDKVVLEAWGKFRVTLLEDVEAGDLLSWYNQDNDYTVQLADDSDSQSADCIAIANGSAGDEIWAALKVVLGTITAQSGDCGRGIPGAVYFAGEDDYLGAPLYLGESGKPESSEGSKLDQTIGRLLARDRILIDLMVTVFKDDMALVFGDGADVTIKWDGSVLLITAFASGTTIQVGENSSWNFDIVVWGDTINCYMKWDMATNMLQFYSHAVSNPSGIQLRDYSQLKFGNDDDIVMKWHHTNAMLLIVGVNKLIQSGISGEGINWKWFGDTVNTYMNWNVADNTLRFYSQGSGAHSVIKLMDWSELVFGTGNDVVISWNGAVLLFNGLPTSNPTVAGALWLNSDVLTRSTG